MYFNSSRLLQSNSRNKTPAVKQKQTYPQIQQPSQQQQQQQQQRKKNNTGNANNNNNNNKKKNHRPTSSCSSLHKKNAKKSTLNDDHSDTKVQDSLEHRKSSGSSTKHSKKDEYPQIQQLPNGERPNFGNSHKSSHKNSNKNNKNYQRRSSSNASGHNMNKTKGKNDEDANDNDVRFIIKNALNMHLNNSAVVSDEEPEQNPQGKMSRTSSHGSNGKSRRGSHRKSLNKVEADVNEKENEDDLFDFSARSAQNRSKAPISPVSPMGKPMMAPPMFLAPPVSSGSPLVQPINHMVAMPPLQQHQQPAPPPPPPPQLSTMFANGPQRGYPYQGTHAMGNTMNVPPLPMQMPIAMPLKQAPSSPHPTFAMNTNSMMLHPAPPQLPQPHFMNMNHHHQNLGNAQHPIMPSTTNQGNYHYYPPQHANRVVPREIYHQSYTAKSPAAPANENKKDSKRNERRNTDVDGDASSTSLNSIGSQYAGASFTINAPTITKLPKPSFV